MADTAKESIESKLAALRKSYYLSLPTKISHIRKLWQTIAVGGANIEMLKALQLAAHTLAGSGATFGAAKISQIARTMDELTSVLVELGRQPDENEKNDIDELVSQLEQASIPGVADDKEIEL